MKWIYLTLFFLLNFRNNFVQAQNTRMTFILSIDNSIPVTNVLNGSFTIFDSLGHTIDSIPFEYHIGWLELSGQSYIKLFTEYSNDEIKISFLFNHISAYDENYTQKYIEKIPKGWLNEQYMILKAYNYRDPFSRKKYTLKKDTYDIEIITPKGKIFLDKNKLINI